MRVLGQLLTSFSIIYILLNTSNSSVFPTGLVIAQEQSTTSSHLGVRKAATSSSLAIIGDSTAKRISERILNIVKCQVISAEHLFPSEDRYTPISTYWDRSVMRGGNITSS